MLTGAKHGTISEVVPGEQQERILTAQRSRNQKEEDGSRISRMERITRMNLLYSFIPAKAGIHFTTKTYDAMLLKITTEIKENAME
ncbi:MAG: hypothetical protein C4532_06595 [Candidatus Abyssobacteria bacterium SURF_17]|uniref:Uncharacterized protein n=1 Tax=Candidatus Abyssobacteria bacterium SURF_17 TaxID=2093361 RepID=A0A419F1D4_9BACT|nr:MAG: hypothetical protein C4532_06595 [Candidatus Abyssubacteria bacterium SURF_17]